MKAFLIILLLALMANCSKLQKQTTPTNNSLQPASNPDKIEAAKYKSIGGNSTCIFSSPDTSLCGIILRDPISTIKIVDPENTVNKLDNYKFYSKSSGEILTMTQHPGDAKNQMSIFKIEIFNKVSRGLKELSIDTFQTEKGIKLGLSKEQIIKKLGTCYTAMDSTKNYIELYYTIEQPNDSRSRILKNNNMPKYFASYKLRDNRLEKFEFGFEYP